MHLQYSICTSFLKHYIDINHNLKFLLLPPTWAFQNFDVQCYTGLYRIFSGFGPNNMTYLV